MRREGKKKIKENKLYKKLNWKLKIVAVVGRSIGDGRQDDGVIEGNDEV